MPDEFGKWSSVYRQFCRWSLSGAVPLSLRASSTSSHSPAKIPRRIGTRYDKTILSFESFISFAAACLWLKSFGNAA